MVEGITGSAGVKNLDSAAIAWRFQILVATLTLCDSLLPLTFVILKWNMIFVYLIEVP